jgi:hypothetical protein
MYLIYSSDDMKVYEQIVGVLFLLLKIAALALKSCHHVPCNDVKLFNVNIGISFYAELFMLLIRYS